MANFTPDELEKYKQWVESLKTPEELIPEDLSELSREKQIISEITSRGEKAASKPIGTLGEIAKRSKQLLPEVSVPSIQSPAEASAEVFQKAGLLNPPTKEETQELVRTLSKPRTASTAKEAAEILAPKELPALLPKRQSPAQASAEIFEKAGLFDRYTKEEVEELVKNLSKAKTISTAEEAAEILAPKELPEKAFKELPTSSPKREIANKILNPEILPKETDFERYIPEEAIETTGKTIKPGSILSKFVKGVPLAAAAYHGGKGDVVSAGLDVASVLNLNPYLMAAGELLSPTETATDKIEQAQKQEALRTIEEDKKLIGLSKNKDQQLKELEYMLGMPLTDSSQLPFEEIQKPKEIKSVQEQKETPVEKSKISTGLGEAEPTKTRASSLKEISIPTQKEEIIEEEKKTNFYDLLEKAKEARDSQILMANLGKAAETLASGLSGTVRGGVVTKPTGADFYDKLIKQAEQKVEDVGTAYTLKTKQDELERLARRRDPASEESKFARELFKSQGIAVPENATAEMLEKYAPQISNIYTQREAREQRAFLAQQVKEAKVSKDLDKEKDATQELTRSFRKELTTGEIGKLGTYARKAKSGVKLIEETIKSPSGYKDFASTYALLKATQGDDSVIREAEMKLGLSLGSLPEKAKSKFLQFFTGKMTSPALRKEMLEAMKLLAKRAEDQYLNAADATLYNAEQYGIPKRLLLGQEFSGSTVENKDKKEQLELPKDKKYAPGSRIKTKQGSYIVDPSGLTATEE